MALLSCECRNARRSFSGGHDNAWDKATISLNSRLWGESPRMEKRIARALILLLAAGSFACNQKPALRFSPADYFPLRPNMVWTYRVISQSQRTHYVVTDEVIGSKYIPSLELTGEVVQEFYNLDRGGLRPIVYYQRHGYLTRLSGLDYEMRAINSPTWGRSEELNFLPERLGPNEAWDNTLFPYGRLPGSFNITQIHKTFFDDEEVTVPAGKFHGCIRIVTTAAYHGGMYDQQKKPLTLTYVDWYAPEVGLVRTVAYEGETQQRELERVELTHFNRDGHSAVAAQARTPVGLPQG
jgi:hypothetical protein